MVRLCTIHFHGVGYLRIKNEESMFENLVKTIPYTDEREEVYVSEC